VVALLDGGGTVQEEYSYDAFGQPTVTDYWGNVRSVGNGRPVSWCGNRFMYTGREYIAELGIYDYRHRFYHPGLGRFLQMDPMGLQTEGAKLTPEQKTLYGAGAPEAFASSEMNLYRYCGDDPMDKSDPMGLEPVIVDEGADRFAQAANQGNLAAYAKENWFLRTFWPSEYGTAVNRDGSGNFSLNGPIRGDHGEVALRKFVGATTIIVTHNHTNQDKRTNSFLSAGDIYTAKRAQKPIYVIMPDGQQDRFRPSDKPTMKERLNDPGVIERLRDGKWAPLDGANPDIRSRVDPKEWR